MVRTAPNPHPSIFFKSSIPHTDRPVQCCQLRYVYMKNERSLCERRIKTSRRAKCVFHSSNFPLQINLKIEKIYCTLFPFLSNSRFTELVCLAELYFLRISVTQANIFKFNCNHTRETVIKEGSKEMFGSR